MRNLVETSNGPPRVSIIVPVYNNARELRECLSALRQSNAASEIIVVDDASTDESASVAAEMGATVHRLARNAGPSAARNHGVRHARADILFFVDADLVVMPGAVDRVLALFDADPTLSAVFGLERQPPAREGDRAARTATSSIITFIRKATRRRPRSGGRAAPFDVACFTISAASTKSTFPAVSKISNSVPSAPRRASDPARQGTPRHSSEAMDASVADSDRCPLPRVPMDAAHSSAGQRLMTNLKTGQRAKRTARCARVTGARACAIPNRASWRVGGLRPHRDLPEPRSVPACSFATEACGSPPRRWGCISSTICTAA